MFLFTVLNVIKTVLNVIKTVLNVIKTVLNVIKTVFCNCKHLIISIFRVRKIRK